MFKIISISSLFAGFILMTYSATNSPAWASVKTLSHTSNSTLFEIAQRNQPDKSDQRYRNGFEAGVEAARNGGPSSPTYDAPTIYIDGYRDGYTQYTNGFEAGVEAARNGGPSSPTYDAPSTYVEAYEEGYASASPGGSIAQRCLEEAARQGYAPATVAADYTQRGGDILLDTPKGTYGCTVKRNGKVSLYPY